MIQNFDQNYVSGHVLPCTQNCHLNSNSTHCAPTSPYFVKLVEPILTSVQVISTTILLASHPPGFSDVPKALFQQLPIVSLFFLQQSLLPCYQLFFLVCIFLQRENFRTLLCAQLMKKNTIWVLKMLVQKDFHLIISRLRNTFLIQSLSFVIYLALLIILLH